MSSESPLPVRGNDAQTAQPKYDRPDSRATLKTQVLGRLGAFALCDLPGRMWWWFVGALALAGLFGAWWGDHAALRHMAGIQSPALARIRAMLSGARALALNNAGGYRRELLDYVQAADDATNDLELPAGYHPRRSTRPLTDKERSLGSVERGRTDA